MGLWFLCGRKLNKILFYLYCFFAELFGLWPMVIMLKHDLPKQLLSNIFFGKPKIQKILVRWFWKFWREQFFISCDTQSFFPHNFSHCSSLKIICFDNWLQCQFFNILRIHLLMCKFVLFCNYLMIHAKLA